MLSKLALAFLLFSMPLNVVWAQPPKKTIRVASKRFTENYIVAEMFSQLLESKGFSVQRKFGMGGTMVAYSALKEKNVDVYPEYTGTLATAVLKTGERNFKKLNSQLSQQGLEMLNPLGFDNSYATVMRKTHADQLNIKSISDLQNHPDLKGAFSFEFQERIDGWKAMQKIYQLENPVQGIEVPLTYEALRNKEVDFVEAYTTEPMILKYGFVVLEDDKQFFPKYDAVPLVHNSVSQEVKNILNELAGEINNKAITRLNEHAVNGIPIPKIANQFLIARNFVSKDFKVTVERQIDWKKMWERTLTHIYLTLLAVFLATLLAVPLATLIAPHKKLSQFFLGLTGILQTIPSIALLTFMIPFFGIGFKPAIVGLFIYSLLPILRNTHTAMVNIDPRLIIAAQGIGLYPGEVLFSVKLPLAFPTILAGIRTATILNIGTATLAAFIGAGGLGEPIVTGLALNDSFVVLQGAVPAALLAIFMDSLFAVIDKIFTKNI